ncbi:putative phage abortive infection protein [Parapusillimonas sp. JC17]|uniref:putative phage abortive infection protein n=1 Tax=Parapusillimonas sp. JC17 TaxID=3445768 RepID=UPI003F9F753C
MEIDTSSSDQDRNTDQIMRSMRVLAYLALTSTIASYFIWFVIVHKHSPSSSTSDWAGFGDFFGGTVGPFIGFASIVLLVETLKLQQRGLKEQRKHLEVTSCEIAAQSRIMLRQAFEQSFFGWLRDYKQQVSGFRFPKVSPEISLKNVSRIPEEHISTGTNAISRMIDFLFSNCSATMRAADEKETKKQKIRNGLVRSWNQIYEHQGEAVRTSLRTLFGILRWIDGHESLEPAEKRHYASVLRAQLSDHELILIYVNGLTETGQPMNDYVNRYALFDNLEIRLYPTLISIYDENDPVPYCSSAFSTDKAIEIHWKNS